MPKRSTKPPEKPVQDAKTAKRKAGRPAFKPSPEQRYSVELMAAIGIPQTSIAAALGVAPNTLAKHFPDELANGRTRTTTKVADSLVRQALAGNITAMIFYLKTQGGWSEKTRVEHSGNIGSLTDAELEAIARGDPVP